MAVIGTAIQTAGENNMNFIEKILLGFIAGWIVVFAVDIVHKINSLDEKINWIDKLVMTTIIQERQTQRLILHGEIK